MCKYPSHYLVLNHPEPVFFLNVRDQVLLTYKRAGEIIILYILIFVFLDIRWKNKRFCTT
jgi:hypothetical protein